MILFNWVKKQRQRWCKMDEFYYKAYFEIGYLKFFYNNQSKEIMEFYQKIKSKFKGKEDIYFIPEYKELCKKFKFSPGFHKEVIDGIEEFNSNKIKEIGQYDVAVIEEFTIKISPHLAIKTFCENLLLLDQFIHAKITISQNNIRQFLISNLSKISSGSILSTHKFYRNTEYFKKAAPDTHPFWWGIETREFVLDHFDELFLNDKGYALSIFIFLDGIVKKYGLSEKLGIFKEIYLKGKGIMEKEFSEEELKEVVKYLIRKKEERGF